MNYHAIRVNTNECDLTARLLPNVVTKESVAVKIGRRDGFHHLPVVSTGILNCDGFLMMRDWTEGVEFSVRLSFDIASACVV